MIFGVELEDAVFKPKTVTLSKKQTKEMDKRVWEVKSLEDPHNPRVLTGRDRLVC